MGFVKVDGEWIHTSNIKPIDAIKQKHPVYVLTTTATTLEEISNIEESLKDRLSDTEIIFVDSIDKIRPERGINIFDEAALTFVLPNLSNHPVSYPTTKEVINKFHSDMIEYDKIGLDTSYRRNEIDNEDLIRYCEPISYLTEREIYKARKKPVNEDWQARIKKLTNKKK